MSMRICALMLFMGPEGRERSTSLFTYIYIIHCIYSLIHSFTHSSSHSLILSFIHSFSLSLNYDCICIHIHIYSITVTYAIRKLGHKGGSWGQGWGGVVSHGSCIFLRTTPEADMLIIGYINSDLGLYI